MVEPWREQPGAERAVAALALVALAIAGVLPPGTPTVVRLLPPLMAAGLVAARWRRGGPVSGLALLVAALTLASGIGVLWQLAMPLALGALAVAAYLRPDLGRPTLERGRVPVAGTLACALVTPLGLVGWVVWLRPDLHDLTAAIPAAPAWALLLGGAAFALVNALFEEWIWRGVIQPRLAVLYGSSAAIAVQAASFGLAHAWGFPRGAAGMLLAGTWAVMLGMLRHHARGLAAVVAAHVVADATIAAIVLLVLR